MVSAMGDIKGFEEQKQRNSTTIHQEMISNFFDFELVRRFESKVLILVYGNTFTIPLRRLESAGLNLRDNRRLKGSSKKQPPEFKLLIQRQIQINERIS